MTAQFSAGAAIGRTFSVWLNLWVPLAAITLVIRAPLAIWNLAHAADLEAGGPAADPSVLAPILTFLFEMIAAVLIGGAAVALVLRRLNGEAPRLADAIARAARRFFGLAGLAFGIGLGVGLASILLLIPGIMVACAWYAATPALIAEDLGMDAALKRSSALTKGRRFAVFLQMAVVWVVAVAPVLLYSVGIVMTRGPAAAESFQSRVVIEVMTVALGALTSVAMTVAYHDLRVAKEGVGKEDLLRMFG